MNSDFAYFDVSNSEYVDPNDEIPIDLKRLIEKDEIGPTYKVVNGTLIVIWVLRRIPKRSKSF